MCLITFNHLNLLDQLFPFYFFFFKMVSFVCDTCQETLKKQKLDAHKSRCYNAVYSCIDCSKTFQGTDYKAHTSCITEVEKYQKPKLQAAKAAIPVPKSKPIVEEIKAAEAPAVTQSKKSKSPADMVLSILKKVLQSYILFTQS